jgi:putative ABC transport system permease protein
MTHGTPAPPRLAARLLARVLAGDPARGAILGDLHEDFVRIRRERSDRAARLWYWGEACALGVPRLYGGAYAALRHNGIREELRHALRSVLRNPAFALFTAAMIALGVGAATAVYSVLAPLILAPLPFTAPDRLVWISNDAADDNSLSAVTSRTANLHDFRERARSFDGITGYNAFFGDRAWTLTGAGEPESIVGVPVAHDFTDVLGVTPIRGRSFAADESTAQVMLSYGFWQRRFAGDPSVVGRTLILNDVARTVAGVLPATFDFGSIFAPGSDVDVLVPFPILADGHAGFQGNTIFMIGRLAAGVSVSAAQAELDAIVEGLGQEQPQRWGLGARVTPLHAHIAGPFHTLLALLAAAAGTLLLIVCVNVSNLLLARSPRRAREVAVRKAMGASHARIARQLLLETLMIALVGAALGALLAGTVVGFVAASAAIEIPLLDRAAIDVSALLVAMVLAVVTGVVAGIVPALQVADGAEAATLRSGTRGSGQSGRMRRTRETFVVAQVALACVLLVTGGLLVRSFMAVLDTDLGFDPANVVTWSQLQPGAPFSSTQERSDYYTALVADVARVPGVERVGLIDALPLGRSRSWGYRVVGEPEREDDARQATPHVIDTDYLAAMRVPLLAGRTFTDRDRENSPPVVVINETAARRIAGDGAALGRRLRFWGSREWEIVGIVNDVRHQSPELDAGIQVYFPIAQMPDYGPPDLVVRSSLRPAVLAAAVAGVAREFDPTLPMREYRTMRSAVDRATSARRFTVGILGACGLIALFLAGLGLYGVLAHSVAERRAEISVRMALGATPRAIVRDVIGRTLRLTIAGVAIGAVLAIAATRLAGSLLFGVGRADPVTFGTTGVLLLSVAALAGAIPAVRAARISVLGAIQSE